MQRSHSDTCQKVPVGSLDPGVDVAASKTTLVERKRSETLTLDTQTRCSRSGDLKSNAEQLVSLPFGLGCWGSTGAMSKTMDEVLRMLQSAHRYEHDATTKSGNRAEVTQTFANTFIWI